MSDTGDAAQTPRGPHWKGYAQSDWVWLDRTDVLEPPDAMGVHRVRSRRRGLAYVGMAGRGKTSSLRTRIAMLRCTVAGRRGHAAGRCICRLSRGPIYVSWVALDVDIREVYGIEVDLIAAHRAVMHESPYCQVVRAIASRQCLKRLPFLGVQ